MELFKECNKCPHLGVIKILPTDEGHLTSGSCLCPLAIDLRKQTEEYITQNGRLGNQILHLQAQLAEAQAETGKYKKAFEIAIEFGAICAADDCKEEYLSFGKIGGYDCDHCTRDNLLKQAEQALSQVKAGGDK